MLYILIFCAGLVAFGVYEDAKEAARIRRHLKTLKDIEDNLCKMVVKDFENKLQNRLTR